MKCSGEMLLSDQSAVWLGVSSRSGSPEDGTGGDGINSPTSSVTVYGYEKQD